jgi:hypothetical protein
MSRQTSSESKAQTGLQTVHDRVVTFFFLPFEIDYAIAYEARGVPKELDLVRSLKSTTRSDDSIALRELVERAPTPISCAR